MKLKKKTVVLVLVIIILMLTSFKLGNFVGRNENKLTFIQSIIENTFPLEYDREYIEDVAAKCMVMALEDPYSVYMDKKEGKSFLEEIEGTYKGIGVTIGYDGKNKNAVIQDILPDTPAEKAGLKKGDILVSVDDLEMSEETYERIIYYIKGMDEASPDDETEMEFTFKRGKETFKVNMKREKFTGKPVSVEDIESNPGIALITLSEFSTESAREFKETVEKIKDKKGIILDLRNNGGGSVTSLLDIAECILPKGTLFYSLDAKGDKTTYEIKDNDYIDLPLVLLVNENTASASEVLTSAVKEKGRGLVIGTTTYGKGLVQGIITFPDGSLLKLTVEKYYTAGGKYINEVGITPDIVIEDDEKQLDRAIEELSK